MMRSPTPAPILVVEDDAATSEFFVDLLREAGYDPHVAMSGEAALTALREHPVAAVVLDWRLPDMDGLAVCRQIRHAIDPVVPIILVTAQHSLALEAAVRDAGVTVYLPKPMPPAVLLRRLAELVLETWST